MIHTGWFVIMTVMGIVLIAQSPRIEGTGLGFLFAVAGGSLTAYGLMEIAQ